MAIRIRSQADLGAGVLIASIALAFLFVGRNLAQGSAVEMGPGFFPRHVALLALGVGVLLILKSVRHAGPPIMRFRLRALLAPVAAVCVFGFCITRFGLLVTAPLTIAIASLASAEWRARRIIATALLVSAAAALLFVKLLGLSIPLLPGG